MSTDLTLLVVALACAVVAALTEVMWLERRSSRDSRIAIAAGTVFAAWAVVAGTLGARGAFVQQQARLALNPQSLEEAIQLAQDERKARAFLDAYVLQSRPGWGNGPLIGIISTPFSRVVRAALAARKKGESFAATDAPLELTAPEFHVIATSQLATTDDAMSAFVTAVVLGPSENNTENNVVKPSKTLDLTKEYQDLNGTAFDRPGMVAIFPLTALEKNNEIRVTFDRIAQGSNALTTCRECVVPLNLIRIR